MCVLLLTYVVSRLTWGFSKVRSASESERARNRNPLTPMLGSLPKNAALTLVGCLYFVVILIRRVLIQLCPGA